MKPLIIVGAGGFGRETAALVEDINQFSPEWDLKGFVDDRPDLHGGQIMDVPVLGSIDWLASQSGLNYVIAVGDSQVRRGIGERLLGSSIEPATLIHPSASFHHTTLIGSGSIVCRGATLTVSIELGCHVIVNLHGTIGHDAQLGDYVTLHPGVHVSGCATIGEATELGTGAVILPGVHVGRGAIIGAGAVVNTPLPDRCTAVGVPARPLRRES